MDGEAQRLHPDDMAALAQVVAGLFEKGMATPPTAPALLPEGVITGLDAKVIRKIIHDAIQENKREIAGPDERSLKAAVRDAVREEIARERERNIEDCRQMIRKEAESICKETFANLDMAIDTPEHRIETARKLGALFEQQARTKGLKSDLWKEIVKAIATQIALGGAGLLAYMGYKSGSGGH